MMTPAQFTALMDASNSKNNEVLKKEMDASIAKNNAVLRKEIQESVKEELMSFKEEVKGMVADSLSGANMKISCLEADLIKKDEEIASLREDFARIQNRTLTLEFSSKKCNLILFKVTENENDKQSLINGICKMIRELADPSFQESDVEEVYRLGKKSAFPRPILLQLKSCSKRSFLLSKKEKFSSKNIGLAEDLPKEVYQWRKAHYELADALRKEGKKVLFRRDKLVVNGVELTNYQIEEEQKQHRKRMRSRSPEASTSSEQPPLNSRRTIPRLNLPKGTPKAQTALEQYYSPVGNRMNKTFEFVSDQ